MRNLPILLLFLSTVVAADTVVLNSGLRVKGAVAEKDGQVVVSLDGKEWNFRRDQVKEILRGKTDSEEFAARTAALGADDAAGWYRLGLWAKEKKLARSKLAFEQVLDAEPDHRAARRELGYEKIEGAWLTLKEAQKAKGFVLVGGRWLLPEEADRLMRKGHMEQATVNQAHRARAKQIVTALKDEDADVRAAARAMMDEVPTAALVRPFRKLLYAPSVKARVFAAKSLGNFHDRVALPWLIRASMYDAHQRVRDAALRSIKGFKDPDIFYPYARAVFSKNPRISINATKVLADLGDLRGVDVVLRKIHIGIGASGRANIFSGTQNSYIQDFDVEIAQAAAIGDPIIQTIRDGVILDYKVLGGSGEAWIVEQRRAYADTLQTLTGRDFGENWKSYEKYARENDYPRPSLR